LVAFAVCVLTIFGGAAFARAEFVATATDPSGDAADANPGRDITSVGMTYNRNEGSLSGFVRFRGSTDGVPSFITLFASVRTATGCNGYPAGGFGTYSDEFGASWLRLDSPTGPAGASGDADKRGFDSEVQTFEASDTALSGRRWDCIVATISEPRNAANVYDSTGPIALVGQPGLSVRVRRPEQFRRNRSQALKITVSNPGDGPARRVKLRLGRARGLSLSPRARSFGTIAAGKREKIRVKVRFSDRARGLTKLPIRASSGRLVAKGTLELKVRTPRRPSGGGGGGGGGQSDPPTLCNRWSPDPFGDTGGSLILVPC
jgi:hypothetical protein